MNQIQLSCSQLWPNISLTNRIFINNRIGGHTVGDLLTNLHRTCLARNNFLCNPLFNWAVRNSIRVAVSKQESYVCGRSGSTVAHLGTTLQLPSSHQQNHNMLCASQRGKRHCKTEDSCFHNRTNCTLHHRTKLVVKTVIKTDRQWSMTHLGTAASQAHCHWPVFKNSHLQFWIVNI